METWVIEVTEFNSEVRCDLRGRLEAAMASEVIYGLGFELSDLKFLCSLVSLDYNCLYSLYLAGPNMIH